MRLSNSRGVPNEDWFATNNRKVDAILGENVLPGEQSIKNNPVLRQKLLNNNQPLATKSLNPEPDWTSSETFGEPILFDTIEVTPISTNFLPKWIKDYVDALAAHTQVQPGAVAMLVLSVLAACIQRRFEVTLSPGYVEPLSIWILLLLPPASRKTALLQSLIAPVIEWEQERAQVVKPEIYKEQTRIAVTKERIKELTRQAGKIERMEDDE